jgi:hypothetical protein
VRIRIRRATGRKTELAATGNPTIISACCREVI